MRKDQINLGDLSFLVADSNPYSCSIAHSILRGFGANRVIEVRTTREAVVVLTEQKIDMLICDAKLPPDGGLSFVRSIRRDPQSPCRTLPVLVLSGDTRISLIKEARDSGANMLVGKPMSPSSFYDRLAWVVFNPRKFVETNKYFGPDRRFRIEGLPDGVGHRSEDQEVSVAEDIGPALSQNEIDGLLQAARSGGA